MKRFLLLFLLVVAAVLPVQAADNPWAVSPTSFALSGVGGVLTFATFQALERRVLGLESHKGVWFWLNGTIATFLPGLLMADYADDGSINGSVFKDIGKCFALDKDSLQKSSEVLIKRAGGVNLIAALLGVLLADHIGGRS